MENLKIENIDKSFNNIKVLKGISFEVGRGEFCVILGPSGCGKTTLLRIIAGLEIQDSGKIFFEGNNEISALSPQERNIAMVFQSYALYPHMNVFDNIAFPLKMLKKSKKEIEKKVSKTANLLGINLLLKRKPRDLSGGERQRVALGRAIIRNSSVFLFDEPLSNLDVRLRAQMRREIISLHKKLKSTSLYVTHDQIEAMTMADKIVLLNNGRIQQIGTCDELYKKPKNIFAASFIGVPEINLIEGKIEKKREGLHFKCGQFSIDLSGRKEAQKNEGKEVTIGIRPESFSIGKSGIRGKLDYLENSGSESIAYIKINGIGKTIAVKVEGNFHTSLGSTLFLEVNTNEIHFFKNGERAD